MLNCAKSFGEKRQYQLKDPTLKKRKPGYQQKFPGHLLLKGKLIVQGTIAYQQDYMALLNQFEGFRACISRNNAKFYVSVLILFSPENITKQVRNGKLP